MAQIMLPARIRKNKGKGAARRLRRNQEVPSIFYGPDRDPVMLAVRYSDILGIVKQSNVENVIIGLEIESDGGKDTRNVMVKELQADPIKDVFFHVDFYEISMTREIIIDIPIHLMNTPVGVTNGGVLQHVRREVTISALPDKLVEFIEVDVSGLDVGEALHIDDITFPEGVQPLLDGTLAIAVVAAPSVSAEAAEGEAGEAEEGGEAQGEVADSDSMQNE